MQWLGRACLALSYLWQRPSPPDYPITPYANQLVFWQSKAYLLGTVWNDDQDFICDPIPIEFSETGVKIIG